MEDRVIFYTTHCPKCHVVEVKLKQKNIPYEENDNVEEMMELGLKNAPNLYAEGKMMDFKEAVTWINQKEVQ